MKRMVYSSIARAIVPALFVTAVSWGQYQVDRAGSPPSEVPAAISAGLQKDGAKISKDGKAWCEIWMASQAPAAGTPQEGQTLTKVAQGALVGVIRFDGQGQDRRGQNIKPGVYTLRYALIPINGDHQGAAPQRDFVVMSPVGADTEPKSLPAFDALMDMSRKASGTPHPAVLSLWKADSDAPAGLSKQGDNDWVLQTKLGDTPISLIVAGTATS